MNDKPTQPDADGDDSRSGCNAEDISGETEFLSREPFLETSRIALRPALGEAEDPIVQPRSEECDTGGAKSSRYLVYGEIARGGMGAILRAHDQTLGRDLAIKVLLSK